MLRNEYQDVIIKTIVRLLVPFVQLYALYVLAHGHYSPGGGFQGGVILAAALVMILLAYGFQEAIQRLKLNLASNLCSIGVLIYVGIGFACLLLGGNFLDYSRLALILRVPPAKARSLGILGIETGVEIAVMAAMYCIIMDIISSDTKKDATQNTDKNELS